MPATDVGETSGKRSISRPQFLSPKSKHSNIIKALFGRIWKIIMSIVNNSGLRNDAENISDISGSFISFFDKTIIDLVTETNRYAEQYKKIRGNLFYFVPC